MKEINKRLDAKEISFTKAEELKKEAAAYHAIQIEQLVSAQEQKLQQLVQDKTDGKIASEDEEDYDTFTIGKADAALAASVFHFGEIDITDLNLICIAWFDEGSMQYF